MLPHPKNTHQPVQTQHAVSESLPVMCPLTFSVTALRCQGVRAGEAHAGG